MKLEPLLYFAYGSNMLRERLTARIGDIAVLGTTTASGYRLAFHKRSRDGSAKCNAWFTGEPSGRLHGVLYALDQDQKTLLDHYEGPSYVTRSLELTITTGTVRAFTYVAREEYITDGAVPYTWYKALVHAGALQHALPDVHVRDIAATRAVRDPDPDRHQSNVEILRAAVYPGIIDLS